MSAVLLIATVWYCVFRPRGRTKRAVEKSESQAMVWDGRIYLLTPVAQSQENPVFQTHRQAPAFVKGEVVTNYPGSCSLSHSTGSFLGAETQKVEKLFRVVERDANEGAGYSVSATLTGFLAHTSQCIDSLWGVGWTRTRPPLEWPIRHKLCPPHWSAKCLIIHYLLELQLSI